MTMLQIDLETARRFVLGRQGLWPGRRWRGEAGMEQAMQEMAYLQLDPLQIMARSHDIQLHSRVLDYRPGQWEQAAYERRRFFDWGAWLAARPMEDLPHWRVVMRRERDGDRDCDPRVRKMGREHAEAVEEMRGLLRERGTLSNRDFDAAARKRTDSYRGSKDSSVALFYLWRTGEVMTHHRENFERVYALTEDVAPPDLVRESSDGEADRFLVMNDIRFLGLSRFQRTADAFRRGVPFSRAKAILEGLLAAGEVVEVGVEGWKFTHYALGEDLPLLEGVAAGRVPDAWEPVDAATEEEVVFLSPLDPVSARGRARILFDFDYVWEVYKPAEVRRYGYYTLPVLWGDRLVARFDGKLDRTDGAFSVLGFWLESEGLGKDRAFAGALARGFARFADFLGADKMDMTGIEEPLLRKHVGS